MDSLYIKETVTIVNSFITETHQKKTTVTRKTPEFPFSIFAFLLEVGDFSLNYKSNKFTVEKNKWGKRYPLIPVLRVN